MKGKKIIITYYEDLKSPEKLKYNLIKISNFMNFTTDMERLNCVLKHPEGEFRRKEICYDRKTKPKSSKSDFIYSNKQTLWINSAIRIVHDEIEKRQLESSRLLSYEDTNIKITYCSCVA